jgi:hypothetical protein
LSAFVAVAAHRFYVAIETRHVQVTIKVDVLSVTPGNINYPDL